jgi:predicted small secreted protein
MGGNLVCGEAYLPQRMALPPARAIRLRVRPATSPSAKPDPILFELLRRGTKATVMKYRSLLAFSLATALMLSGCNTIAGMGRDIESVGDTVEDAAT